MALAKIKPANSKGSKSGKMSKNLIDNTKSSKNDKNDKKKKNDVVKAKISKSPSDLVDGYRTSGSVSQTYSMLPATERMDIVHSLLQEKAQMDRKVNEEIFQIRKETTLYFNNPGQTGDAFRYGTNIALYPGEPVRPVYLGVQRELAEESRIYFVEDSKTGNKTIISEAEYQRMLREGVNNKVAREHQESYRSSDRNKKSYRVLAYAALYVMNPGLALAVILSIELTNLIAKIARALKALQNEKTKNQNIGYMSYVPVRQEYGRMMLVINEDLDRLKLVTNDPNLSEAQKNEILSKASRDVVDISDRIPVLQEVIEMKNSWGYTEVDYHYKAYSAQQQIKMVSLKGEINNLKSSLHSMEEGKWFFGKKKAIKNTKEQIAAKETQLRNIEQNAFFDYSKHIQYKVDGRYMQGYIGLERDLSGKDRAFYIQNDENSAKLYMSQTDFLQTLNGCVIQQKTSLAELSGVDKYAFLAHESFTYSKDVKLNENGLDKDKIIDVEMSDEIMSFSEKDVENGEVKQISCDDYVQKLEEGSADKLLTDFGLDKAMENPKEVVDVSQDKSLAKADKQMDLAGKSSEIKNDQVQKNSGDAR